MREHRTGHDLGRLLDEVLISGLPAGLKAAIDDCLSKGGDPAVVRQIIERGTTTAPLTRHAAEAYLELRLKGEQ